MDVVNGDSYHCSTCGGTFTQLDVVHLFDNAMTGFTCPEDGSLLNPLASKESGQAEETRVRYEIWFLGTMTCRLLGLETILQLMTNIPSHRWTANKKPIVELLEPCNDMELERYTDAMASRDPATASFGKGVRHLTCSVSCLHFISGN